MKKDRHKWELERALTNSHELAKASRFSSQKPVGKSKNAPYSMRAEFVPSKNYREYLSVRRLASGWFLNARQLWQAIEMTLGKKHTMTLPVKKLQQSSVLSTMECMPSTTQVRDQFTGFGLELQSSPTFYTNFLTTAGKEFFMKSILKYRSLRLLIDI